MVSAVLGLCECNRPWFMIYLFLLWLLCSWWTLERTSVEVERSFVPCHGGRCHPEEIIQWFFFAAINNLCFLYLVDLMFHIPTLHKLIVLFCTWTRQNRAYWSHLDFMDGFHDLLLLIILLCSNPETPKRFWSLNTIPYLRTKLFTWFQSSENYFSFALMFLLLSLKSLPFSFVL